MTTIDFTQVPQVSLIAGGMPDHLSMRAAQLAALTTAMSAGAFSNMSDDIQGNLRWLASSLAEEVSTLVEQAIPGLMKLAQS
jgi:hypothetical protein